MTKFRLNAQQPRDTDHVDEIEDFWNGRYLSAGEADWRILGFHITKKDPSVTALPIHLPHCQYHKQYTRNDGSHSQLSLLDRYFLRPTGTFMHGDHPRSFSSLTYLEYYALFRLDKFDECHTTRPAYYVEQPNNQRSPRMHVIQRTKKTAHLTRIHHVRPSHGDVYYLRCILQNQPAQSFIDARTVGDTIFATYQEAAKEKGLFSDATESTLTLTEGVVSLCTPRQLRILFADLLVNDCVDFPLVTWQTFADHLSYDFFLRHSNSSILAEAFALDDLQNIIKEHGKHLSDYGLPQPNLPSDHETLTEIERWTRNASVLMNRATSQYQQFNDEQRAAFDLIWNAVENNEPLLSFMDGKAGTGKTTVINVLCDVVRATSRIILPTATSACAALLYPGGRTTHSTFKVRLSHFTLQSFTN